MLPAHRMSLTQFLIEERKRFPEASGDFNHLLLDVAMACKRIAHAVSFGDLMPYKLSDISEDALAELVHLPKTHANGKYLLLFDAIDGVSNIDMNVSLGSVFSILRAPEPLQPNERRLNDDHFLQEGREQVAAGYAIYGPSTMLILSVGRGVVGFTLDPNFKEFMLTHPDLKIPADTQEFAINASNRRFWEVPVQQYVDECLAGRTGPRHKDFSMRWIASMVAEAHRILMRGGVCLYPRDTKNSGKSGQLRLLNAANPVGFIIEQAGGGAITGSQQVLDIKPQSLDQRIGFIFGSKNEVERIQRYHREPQVKNLDAPLFGERSLFRDWTVSMNSPQSVLIEE